MNPGHGKPKKKQQKRHFIDLSPEDRARKIFADLAPQFKLAPENFAAMQESLLTICAGAQTHEAALLEARKKLESALTKQSVSPATFHAKQRPLADELLRVFNSSRLEFSGDVKGMIANLPPLHIATAANFLFGQLKGRHIGKAQQIERALLPLVEAVENSGNPAAIGILPEALRRAYFHEKFRRMSNDQRAAVLWKYMDLGKKVKSAGHEQARQLVLDASKSENFEDALNATSKLFLRHLNLLSDRTVSDARFFLS